MYLDVIILNKAVLDAKGIVNFEGKNCSDLQKVLFYDGFFNKHSSLHFVQQWSAVAYGGQATVIPSAGCKATSMTAELVGGNACSPQLLALDGGAHVIIKNTGGGSKDCNIVIVNSAETEDDKTEGGKHVYHDIFL